MSTPQHRNPKQHSKRPPQKKAPALTPEEQLKVLAAQQKAAEEANAERQRIELYGRSVEKMSHRQLRGEFVRLIRREHAGKPPEPQPGLNIALASVFLTVLDNTKTSRVFETDKKGNPTRVARPDQINPFGMLHAYPR